MQEIRWEFYPLVAQQELACAWLTMQRNLQLASTAIDAYGRNLNDYLVFCFKHNLLPETRTCKALALYVQDLATRVNPRGANMLSIGSGYGLSRATCCGILLSFVSTMIFSLRSRLARVF